MPPHDQELADLALAAIVDKKHEGRNPPAVDKLVVVDNRDTRGLQLLSHSWVARPTEAFALLAGTWDLHARLPPVVAQIGVGKTHNLC